MSAKICPYYIFSIIASKPINMHWILEKSCIESYYRQFSTNIRIKIIKLITVFLARAFGTLKLTKLVSISYNFSFQYLRKAVYNTIRQITIPCLIYSNFYIDFSCRIGKRFIWTNAEIRTLLR